MFCIDFFKTRKKLEVLEWILGVPELLDDKDFVSLSK